MTILDHPLVRLRTKDKAPETDLSGTYEAWKKTYNDLTAHMEASDDRVVKMDSIARALFKEWSVEA